MSNWAETKRKGAGKASERKSLKARLLDLPPMSIGIQTIISDSHLPLVGDVRSYPGYELQVVHRLLVAGALADLERLTDNDHILSVMPFGLSLSPR